MLAEELSMTPLIRSSRDFCDGIRMARIDSNHTGVTQKGVRGIYEQDFVGIIRITGGCLSEPKLGPEQSGCYENDFRCARYTPTVDFGGVGSDYQKGMRHRNEHLC